MQINVSSMVSENSLMCKNMDLRMEVCTHVKYVTYT